MRLPLVLAAWEPEDPQEAIRLHAILGKRARIQWAHELTPDLRKTLLPEVDAVMLFSWPDWLTPELPRMKRLRFLQRCVAGVETLPFPQLARKKPAIQLASASGANADPVAEHAWALVLACAKHVARHDQAVRRGEFHQLDWVSQELRGKTLGILGYGAIGQRVARFGRAFGMNVLAIRRQKTARGPILGDLRMLPRLLQESDVVVVSLPLTPRTRGVLDVQRLRLLKTDAILVNVSRGSIVDEDALFDLLVHRPTFTTGLDVWWHYPKEAKPFRQRRPFHELPNVVMTPHAASMVPDWRRRMVEFGARNVAAFIAGRQPHNLVDVRDYLEQV